MLLSFGGAGLDPGSRPQGLIHLVNVNAESEGPGLGLLTKAALGTIHACQHTGLLPIMLKTYPRLHQPSVRGLDSRTCGSLKADKMGGEGGGAGLPSLCLQACTGLILC